MTLENARELLSSDNKSRAIFYLVVCEYLYQWEKLFEDSDAYSNQEEKPLKTLGLSQVSFPLLFPLCYIVPPAFMDSDKGKYTGAGHAQVVTVQWGLSEWQFLSIFQNRLR